MNTDTLLRPSDSEGQAQTKTTEQISRIFKLQQDNDSLTLAAKLDAAHNIADQLAAALQVVTYELSELLSGGSRPNAGAYAEQQAKTALTAYEASQKDHTQ